MTIYKESTIDATRMIKMQHPSSAHGTYGAPWFLAHPHWEPHENLMGMSQGGSALFLFGLLHSGVTAAKMKMGGWPLPAPLHRKCMLLV